MNRVQWKSRRTMGVVLGLIILYLTIRVRNYEHKMLIFLPKVHPNEPWEFVADFSNMKYLNPTIVDFSIVEESGNYDHWKYTAEYSERLSHWPHIPNYATAYFQVKATPKMDVFFIHSSHRTCMFANIYCYYITLFYNFIKQTITKVLAWATRQDNLEEITNHYLFKVSETSVRITEHQIRFALVRSLALEEKMSKHLTKGSVEPARKAGLLRLFSMQFCPFAHRARLVLKAKQIPHDIININLMSKPEWYIKIHPEGKVPALIDGDKVIVESLDICNYLDEKFLENSLYPAEPAAKEKDKEVIQKIGPAVAAFNHCLFGHDEKTPEEWLKELLEPLQPLEDELSARSTKFFGGDKPNMVDYVLWPWAERAGCLSLKLGAKLPVQEHHIPLLRKWRKAMREDSVASELYYGPEVFWKVVQFKLKNEDPDYDSVLA